MKPATYLYWVRFTAKGCLLSWRNLRTLLADVVDPFRDLMLALWFVLLALMLPLLTPFAPIIALLLRREYRRQAAREAAANNEWQDEFLKNAQREDS